MPSSKQFPTKIDGWIGLVLGGTAVILALVSLSHLHTDGPTHPAFLTLVSCLLFYLLILLGVAFPVSYTIAPPYLIIRSGFTRSRIELAAIHSITETRNPLSAPALSLDRLEIRFTKANGKESYNLISPKDKRGFLREMSRHCPNLDSPNPGGEDDRDGSAS